MSCQPNTAAYEFTGESVGGNAPGAAIFNSLHPPLTGGSSKRSSRRSSKRSSRRSVRRSGRRPSKRPVRRRTSRRSSRKNVKMQGRRAVYRVNRR